MAIIRNEDQAPEAAAFRVNLNIILNGSKKMDYAQQDELMEPHPRIHVLIHDPDTNEILVDAECQAHEFKTGSVGYSLQLRDQEFE